jgi:hypothetical protein
MVSVSRRSTKISQNDDDLFVIPSSWDVDSSFKKLNTRKGMVDLLLGPTNDEEYNPLIPNDFEKLLQKRKNLKR